MLHDCILFFDESPLLDFRLSLLDGLVDHFVIMESLQTFSGKTKDKLYAPSVLEKLSLKSKVTYVDYTYPTQITDPWPREHYTRNLIRSYLGDDPTDIAMLCDVDEVPDPLKINYIKDEASKNLVTLRLEWLQLRATNRMDNVFLQNTRAATLATIDQIGGMQQLRRSTSGKMLSMCGWHFNSMGGPKYLKTKISNYAHTEYNNNRFLDETRLNTLYEQNTDFLARKEYTMSPYPRENLPELLFSKPEYLEYFGMV